MTNKTFQFTGHLSEGSFVRNGVVQIPKFEVIRNPSPYYAYMFRTNDPSDKWTAPKHFWCYLYGFI